MNNEIKLNLGCGGRPLKGYINVDMDSLDELKKRYPNTKFSNDIIVKNLDIFNLPYNNNSVQEVRADSFIEHLSFIEEKNWNTVYKCTFCKKLVTPIFSP